MSAVQLIVVACGVVIAAASLLAVNFFVFTARPRKLDQVWDGPEDDRKSYFRLVVQNRSSNLARVSSILLVWGDHRWSNLFRRKNFLKQGMWVVEGGRPHKDLHVARLDGPSNAKDAENVGSGLSLSVSRKSFGVDPKDSWTIDVPTERVVRALKGSNEDTPKFFRVVTKSSPAKKVRRTYRWHKFEF